MKVMSENECQSVVGTVLTNYTHIVENILNSLDNSELLKCKYVCRFWKRIADKIMNGRIIVIKRNIPYQMTRMAITQPYRLQCLHFQPSHRDQFLLEFNFNYIKCRHLEFLKTEGISSKNCKIMTQMAMFPSLPGIKVERFLFDSKHKQLSSEKRITHLRELINVSKEELKCILWFTKNSLNIDEIVLPDFGVPSLLLSTTPSIYKFDQSEYYAITLSGKRMNAVMLKIVDDPPYKRIKSKFINEIKKVKDYELDPFKCVALIFTNQNLTLETPNNVLCLFKETFPNIPILLYSELLLLDIPTFMETTYRDEDYWLFFEHYFELNDVALIRILLIWLN